MRYIRSSTDLSNLDKLNFPSPLIQFVTELFSVLYQSCNFEGQPPETFQLDSLGSTVVLEPNDRLTPLLDSFPFGPEYIEKTVILGTPIYRIGCLFDNDLIAQYVIWDEWLDTDEKQLLAQLVDQGDDSDERK